MSRKRKHPVRKMTEKDYENYLMSLKDEKPVRAVVPRDPETETKSDRLVERPCLNAITCGWKGANKNRRYGKPTHIGQKGRKTEKNRFRPIFWLKFVVFY